MLLQYPVSCFDTAAYNAARSFHTILTLCTTDILKVRRCKTTEGGSRADRCGFAGDVLVSTSKLIEVLYPPRGLVRTIHAWGVSEVALSKRSPLIEGYSVNIYNWEQFINQWGAL